MLQRDIEQIKQAKATALASIAQAQLEADQIITHARQRLVLLIQERKQTSQAESLVIRTEGNTVKINRFLYGRRNWRLN